MSGTHRWTYDEDRYCCEKYIECYVISKSELSASEFVRELSFELTEIKPTSLRMKVQNIKQILIEKQISDSLKISPSANYSLQNLLAMESILKQYKI